MKKNIEPNLKGRFGVKVGLAILVILFLGLLSFPVWGVPGDYVGTYSGDYSGDDNGIWIANVSGTTGYIRFITWSNRYKTVDGGEDNVGDNGEIVLTTDDGTDVTGDIDGGTFNVTGTWVNAAKNGNLSGTQQDPSQLDNYDGNYSGEFCGDSDGTWDITVETTGYVWGYFYPDGGGSEFVEGGVNASGEFILYADSEDAGVRGTIQSDGDITGYWRNETWGENGYISNKSTCGPLTSTLGGSGSSGCFISSLFN